MWKDPIVEEVRAHRRKFSAEFGHDAHALFQQQRDILKRWKTEAMTKDQVIRERAAECRSSS